MLGIELAAALIGLMGQAQEVPPAVAPVPDVLVVGAQAQVVGRYLDAVPDVNRPDEPLARFDRRVCPGVVNMEAHAQRIIDRIAMAATEAGLSVGAPGCSPNILVVFTTRADETAEDLRRRAPAVFDDVARTRRSGRTQLREFLESDASVRWWQSTTDEPAIAGVDLSLMTKNWQRPGDDPRPTYRGGGAARTRPGSYMSSASRMDINMAVVIVDMAQIDRVDVDAIGDYAAFVALGQVDPHADVTGMDTILNLFRPGAGRITGLSQFDRAYLNALYDSRGDAARASQQKSEIAAGMLRTLNPTPTP